MLQHGTYVAAVVDDTSSGKLREYIKSLGIKNPNVEDNYHLTLLFSKDVDNSVTADPESYPITCNEFKLQLFNPPDGRNILVLGLEQADALHERHNHFISNHNVTHAFPDFRAHITLSYDCGTSDISQLPLPDFPLSLSHEKVEDLNENWCSDNGKNQSRFWLAALAKVFMNKVALARQ